MKYTRELMQIDTLYRTRRNPFAARWNLACATAVPGPPPPVDGQIFDDQLTRKLQREVEAQDEADLHRDPLDLPGHI